MIKIAGTISHIQTRSAALYVSNAAVTYLAAESIDQISDKGNVFKVKNLTITPPSSEVEKVDLWGSDALDTIGSGVPVIGTFQHQALSEKSWTEAKISGTAVFSHDELGVTTPAGDSFEVLFCGNGIDVSDTPAFTRYAYGDVGTTSGQRLRVGNLIAIFNNGSGISNAAMANVIVTKMGDIKTTGADGHWEFDFEAVCLAKDYAYEVED